MLLDSRAVSSIPARAIPRARALEEALASLEGGRYGLAFASGVAATTAVLQPLLKPGDHVVAGDDIYGGTYRLFERLFRPWGVDIAYANATEPDSFAQAVTEKTKLIWVETPTNPLLRIVDLRELGQLARDRKLWLAVDNTFASPYFQRPLELGAHIVVHSTTKYLGGHSDVIGGAVITSEEGVFSSDQVLSKRCRRGAGLLG